MKFVCCLFFSLQRLLTRRSLSCPWSGKTNKCINSNGAERASRGRTDGRDEMYLTLNCERNTHASALAINLMRVVSVGF